MNGIEKNETVVKMIFYTDKNVYDIRKADVRLAAVMQD